MQDCPFDPSAGSPWTLVAAFAEAAWAIDVVAHTAKHDETAIMVKVVAGAPATFDWEGSHRMKVSDVDQPSECLDASGLKTWLCVLVAQAMPWDVEGSGIPGSLAESSVLLDGPSDPAAHELDPCQPQPAGIADAGEQRLLLHPRLLLASLVAHAVASSSHQDILRGAFEFDSTVC